jgi:hypothetical protein
LQKIRRPQRIKTQNSFFLLNCNRRSFVANFIPVTIKLTLKKKEREHRKIFNMMQSKLCLCHSDHVFDFTVAMQRSYVELKLDDFGLHT